jgi:hypothetical protein
MILLSGCNPCVFYDADVHPAPLLAASTIAAGCALVLFVCVVVAIMVFWRDERPAWKRVIPIVEVAPVWWLFREVGEARRRAGVAW